MFPLAGRYCCLESRDSRASPLCPEQAASPVLCTDTSPASTRIVHVDRTRRRSGINSVLARSRSRGRNVLEGHPRENLGIRRGETPEMDWANVTPGELMDALREVRVIGLVTRRFPRRDPARLTRPTRPGRRNRPEAPKLMDKSHPLRLPRRWTGTCARAP